VSTILAIDIGTSSTKALVVNEHGVNVFNVRKNYQTDFPQDDWSEQNPEDTYHAVIKIIFALYSFANLLEENSRAYDTISASGGFTQSPEWVQIIADIFGKPVRVSEHDDASAVGAAMLGFQTLGVKYSCTTPSAEFTPNENMHAIYLKQYAVYKQLTTKLKDTFHTLSKLKSLA